MTLKPSARRSVDQTCTSSPSSPPNSWRCRRFTDSQSPGRESRQAGQSGPRSSRGARHRRRLGNLRRALARIVGDDEDRVLNPLVRALMAELREELTELDARIAGYDRKIRELYRNSEICQRLGKVEGIGPVTATALVAAVGDRSSFKNGRQFAAWLGLVPKQRSSGGRARLLGISKRGDRYLRTLLIHGAGSALGRVRDKQDPRSL
jgi:transposase